MQLLFLLIIILQTFYTLIEFITADLLIPTLVTYAVYAS